MNSAEHEGLRPKGNVPNLRFPEFSGEWEETTLKDISIINPESATLEESFIYIDLESVEKGILKKERVICRSEAPSRARRIINEGDILYQCVRPYQRNNYIHKKPYNNGKQWVASTGYAQIRTSECPHYIYHLVNTDCFNRKVIIRCTGSNYPAINSEDLSFIRFYYTPIKEEQKKIAKLLSLLDDRIATQNKIIDKLQSLIKGIDDKLLFNDAWTTTRLYDILTERIEKSKMNNQYEVLSSTVKGIYLQRDYFSKDIASENNVGYKIIYLHDIVLSPQNLWMGNINYNNGFDIGIVSPSYKIYKVSPKFDKYFIASILRTHRALYKYQLISEQGASIVRRNLNMEAFEQLTFKIPSYDLQVKIGCAISLLQKQLDNAFATKQAYYRQKQYLLSQMFI